MTRSHLLVSVVDEAVRESLPDLISAKADASPIVFIVDDDISVKESLESLIRFVGWQAGTLFDAASWV